MKILHFQRDERKDGAGAEAEAMKVERVLALLLGAPAEPSVAAAFGAGGFTISVIPSSIWTTFPIVGL